jgi:hypothetical protein
MTTYRSVQSSVNDIHYVLSEREKTYGSFKDNADVTNGLYELVERWVSEEDPYIKEALHMILHKISRIACGNPKYKDSWVDIIGYSQCVLDILQQQHEETTNVSIN